MGKLYTVVSVPNTGLVMTSEDSKELSRWPAIGARKENKIATQIVCNIKINTRIMRKKVEFSFKVHLYLYLGLRGFTFRP